MFTSRAKSFNMQNFNFFIFQMHETQNDKSEPSEPLGDNLIKLCITTEKFVKFIYLTSLEYCNRISKKYFHYTSYAVFTTKKRFQPLHIFSPKGYKDCYIGELG